MVTFNNKAKQRPEECAKAIIEGRRENCQLKDHDSKDPRSNK